MKSSRKAELNNALKELGAIFLLLLLLLGLGVLNKNSKNPRAVANSSVKNFPLHSRDVIAPVFMYHHIGEVPLHPDIFRKDLTVSVADFTAQVEYLKSSGYSCVGTIELYKYQIGEIELNKKPCVITFDDGFADTLKNAVPILVKNQMQGSFAIITRFVGQPEYANWQTLSDAKTLGMEIIPHSQHHIDFTSNQYNHQVKQSEVQGSIKDVQDRLGVTPVAFVYPYGNYDLETEKILADSGIKFAFTTEYGLYDNHNNPYEMPRVRVHGKEDITLFVNLLNQAK
jgi:peptidoglycan/xylan/chitin deacetylase (PgdA/CDA1 family)